MPRTSLGAIDADGFGDPGQNRQPFHKNGCPRNHQIKVPRIFHLVGSAQKLNMSNTLFCLDMLGDFVDFLISSSK